MDPMLQLWLRKLSSRVGNRCNETGDYVLSTP